jgi:tetratricopeptide (TPR) repeat protein
VLASMSITEDDVTTIQTKPKLIFFQYEYSARLPEFLLIHKREHVACLSEFFDVIVIDKDCDYQQICDQYQPDLTLFESGVPNPACKRLAITNTSTHSHIPKLGFLHADAFCCARAGFLSDMDQWGIETFVAIATSAPEHMSAIANRLFLWPNCVNPGIYRDYKQWKTTPVLFTGNKNDIYPWRKKIIRIVPKYYPSLICPHPGYGTQRTVSQIVVGESYARMLNAAWFVPACGTVAKEVVRKHFEIPACASCLVAERSPALEAAGFVDMVNCVFADEHDVIDKLDSLFRDAEQLNRIIKSGHTLVMSRHTNKHRNQILQWFNLQKDLKNNRRITQANPFAPLEVVDYVNSSERPYFVSGGQHLQLLREGDKKLWAGDYAEAEKLYLKCANYIPYMPEPKFRLGLCSLYKGDAKKAIGWIVQPLQFTLGEYKAADPDPVEWAYFLVSLLCQGKVKIANKRASEFYWLCHTELDRVRHVIVMLAQADDMGHGRPMELTKKRPSIHQLPVRPFDEWLEQLRIMLRACGQSELADRIVTQSLEKVDSSGLKRLPTMSEPSGYDVPLNGRLWPVRVGIKKTGTAVFQRHLLIGSIRSRIRQFLRKTLHKLEERYQYFLPYHLSAARNDDLFQIIEELSREEDITTVLIVGARPGVGSTEALMAGLRQNANKPSAYCLTDSSRTATRWFPRLPISSIGCMWYTIASVLSGTALKLTIDSIKLENNLNSFDLVLVDGSELGFDVNVSRELRSEFLSARFVVLDDINLLPNGESHNTLLRDPRFVPVDQNPHLRDGFSIFKQMSAERSRASVSRLG